MAEDTLSAKVQFSGMEEAARLFTESAKAIAEAFGLAKEKTEGLSDEQKRAAAAAEEHARVQKSVAEVMKSSGIEPVEKITETLRKSRQALLDLEKTYDDQAKRTLPEYEKAVKAVSKEIEDLERKARKARDEMSFKDRVGAVGESVAEREQRGLSQGLSRITSSIPLAGGLLGLIFYGKAATAQVEADAAKLADVFDTAVGRTVRNLGTMKGEMRDLEVRMAATTQEYAANAQALVDSGIRGEDVGKMITRSWTEGSESVSKATLQLDKWLNVGSGTSAKAIGQIMADTNHGLEESIDLYTRLAGAARQSGGGVLAFMQTVQQAEQQLRMFGVDIQDVAKLLGGLEEGAQGMGLRGPAAARVAREGLTGIVGGLTSMGVGMQGVLAERMGLGGGLAGRQEFRGGLERLAGGEGGAFLTDFVKQMRQMAKEQAGGGEVEQRYFLEQQGFGFAGAQAIMKLAGNLDKGMALDPKDVKELQNAFGDESKKTNQFLAALKNILEGMRLISTGLLDAVVTGFLGVIAGLAALPDMIRGRPDTPAARRFEKVAAEFEGAQGDIAKGIDYLFKGAEGGAEAALGGRILRSIKAFTDKEKEDGPAPAPSPLDPSRNPTGQQPGSVGKPQASLTNRELIFRVPLNQFAEMAAAQEAMG